MKHETVEIPEFSEESFWRKISKKIVKTCGAVAEKAVTMYYCMMDRDTPFWAKSKIAAALSYFVLPVDLIPDTIPVAGYTDDAAFLALAFATVVMHIKPEHGSRAKELIETILGRSPKK
jgi:uncharacterized membrane protein YkvA (DUF1232 family)